MTADRNIDYDEKWVVEDPWFLRRELAFFDFVIIHAIDGPSNLILIPFDSIDMKTLGCASADSRLV